MINRYNSIAFLYYPLAKLFYGNSLKRIQSSLLTQLKTEGSYLLIGGGNGELLHPIFQHATQITVDYLEASSAMIAKAKRLHKNDARINYIHGVDWSQLTKKYDVIILPFVLDTFTQKELEACPSVLKRLLLDDGQILITDFFKANGLLQSLLVKLTILFFRLFTSHSNRELLDVFTPFSEPQLKHLSTSYLKKKLLRSSLYTAV